MQIWNSDPFNRNGAVRRDFFAGKSSKYGRSGLGGKGVAGAREHCTGTFARIGVDVYHVIGDNEHRKNDGYPLHADIGNAPESIALAQVKFDSTRAHCHPRTRTGPQLEQNQNAIQFGKALVMMCHNNNNHRQHNSLPIERSQYITTPIRLQKGWKLFRGISRPEKILFNIFFAQNQCCSLLVRECFESNENVLVVLLQSSFIPVFCWICGCTEHCERFSHFSNIARFGNCYFAHRIPPACAGKGMLPPSPIHMCIEYG